MTDRNPAREFGVLPPGRLMGMAGLDFCRGLIDGSLPAPPFSEATDIWIAEAEPGRIVFEGLPSARFHNPMGIVHGGWIATLLDSAMGSVVHAAMAPGQGFTTTQMTTTYTRPVSGAAGILRCEARLLHLGRRVASAEGKVFDAKGKLVAHGSESCLIMEG